MPLQARFHAFLDRRLQVLSMVLILLVLLLGNLRASVTVALILPLAALATFILMRQQFSMRMRTIAISLLDKPLPFLYKTLGTCSRLSSVYELPLSIRLQSIDLQSPCGVLSRHR